MATVPEPERPTADELDDVVAFIAGQQAHPDRQVTYVGTEAPGIAAELAGLSPPWATTLRVVRAGDGDLAGVVVAEWDVELGRAWVLGPWVDGDGEAWAAVADALVDAALAQVPAAVTRYELAGDVANVRLADLARRRGWVATEPNHVLVADAAVVAGWLPGRDDQPDQGPGRRPAGEAGDNPDDGAGDNPDDGAGDAVSLRPPTSDDVAAVAALHDAEFPETYASAAQLVAGSADGSRLVLVADDGEDVVGYAAGQVHDDGEGFVDFVAVRPGARGAGLGGRLVRALTRSLLERAPADRVALTVQDHRAPARALYDRLGFRPDGVLVAYRSWT